MTGHIPARVRHIATPDGAVLLDVQTGRCYGLNATGSAIWSALCAGAIIEQVVHQLAARFAADEDRIRADVGALVAGLCDAGLLTREPEPS